jgi:hypothetical protein
LAWEQGNLPVSCITLEEFDLIIAFSDGVKSKQNQGKDGPTNFLDPRKIPALQKKRLGSG